MPFNKEDSIMIKRMYLLKWYTVLKLLKEFQSKSWNEKSFQRLLNNRDTGSVATSCWWPHVEIEKCIRQYLKFQGILEFIGRHCSHHPWSFQSRPQISEDISVPIHCYVFSGSVATQQRWGGKLCMHVEAMIFNTLCVKIFKNGSSCFKL